MEQEKKKKIDDDEEKKEEDVVGSGGQQWRPMKTKSMPWKKGGIFFLLFLFTLWKKEKTNVDDDEDVVGFDNSYIHV